MRNRRNEGAYHRPVIPWAVPGDRIGGLCGTLLTFVDERFSGSTSYAVEVRYCGFGWICKLLIWGAFRSWLTALERFPQLAHPLRGLIWSRIDALNRTDPKSKTLLGPSSKVEAP